MSLRPIYSENRHGERYMQLLHSADPRIRLYVYRLENRRRIKPAIYSGPPIRRLEEYLQRTFGGGEFEIMIRRGETMLESGTIGIAAIYRNLGRDRR